MKKLPKFIIGFALGAMLAISASAWAGAGVFGGNGYLMGYTVMVNGNEVCSDPYVWSSTREIECD